MIHFYFPTKPNIIFPFVTFTVLEKLKAFNILNKRLKYHFLKFETVIFAKVLVNYQKYSIPKNTKYILSIVVTKPRILSMVPISATHMEKRILVPIIR